MILKRPEERAGHFDDGFGYYYSPLVERMT